MRVQSFQDGVEFLGTPLKDLHSTRDEKVGGNRIEQVLVSNSSLVSGLSEASGVKFSWAEVSRKSEKNHEHL